MKKLLLLPVLVLVSAFGMSVCRKSEPKLEVSQLEELPKDIADNLKRIPNLDVLVSIAHGLPSFSTCNEKTTC